jgi:hypothetical protein
VGKQEKPTAQKARELGIEDFMDMFNYELGPDGKPIRREEVG